MRVEVLGDTNLYVCNSTRNFVAQPCNFFFSCKAVVGYAAIDGTLGALNHAGASIDCKG